MQVRILQIVTNMGRGGLETMLMNYYRHIDRDQVQFDFLVHRSEPADYDEEILSMGGIIHRLPTLNPTDAAYRRAANTFFMTHPEYRVVHSHLDCMSSVPLRYAKKAGVPVRIAHAHSSNQTKDTRYPLKIIYRNRILKYATHLYACGQRSGQWMFRGKPFSVLKNAIDAEQYVFNRETRQSVRERLGVGPNELLVGHVGSMTSPKNHEFIVEIFAALKKRQPESALILVGDGWKRERIQALVDEKGLTKSVIFTGIRSDVPQLLQAMDVFLLPSIFEGVPLVLIEAQAADLPCVISECVPSETLLIPRLFRRLELSVPAEKWAETIVSVSNGARENTLEDIRAAGYDIRLAARQLERLYLNLYAEAASAGN